VIKEIIWTSYRFNDKWFLKAYFFKSLFDVCVCCKKIKMTSWLYFVLQYFMNSFWRELIFDIEIRIYCSVSAIILTNREKKSCREKDLYSLRHCTIGCSVVMRKECKRKSSRCESMASPIESRKSVEEHKNRQDAFFTSYWSQRTAFAVRQQEAPACTRLHGSWIFNTHAHRGHAMEEWRKVSRIVTVMCA